MDANECKDYCKGHLYVDLRIVTGEAAFYNVIRTSRMESTEPLLLIVVAGLVIIILLTHSSLTAC